MLASYWNARAGGVVGTPEAAPELLWEGVEKSGPPAQSDAFARVTILHASGRQRSLASDTGTRRFERDGIVTVQCFAPRGRRGPTLAEALASVAKDAFEGKASPGGVWFRNATIKEVGPDKGWFQVNAVVQFQYDEVK